ncbi:MAG: zinc ribbon domain-containing protein [Nitrospirae bacterium]|nr:zinc ribbon domain-containing protein [Nitrospirota bacterium]
MPIYEYTCMDCTKQFTLIQKMGASDAVCPWCNSENTSKLLSQFSCTPTHEGGGSTGGHFGGT